MKRFMIAAMILMAVLTMGCISTETEYGTATYNPITEQAVLYVDAYEDGYHLTGRIIVTNGTEDYYNIGFSGYIDGYPVEGTMTGYESSVRRDYMVYTPYGNFQDHDYIDMR